MAKKLKLNKMILSAQASTKIRGKSAEDLTQWPDEKDIAIVIKVKQADYVPKQVQEIARVSPVLFTGRMKKSTLSNLEKDPLVISVEISETLKGD